MRIVIFPVFIYNHCQQLECIYSKKILFQRNFFIVHIKRNMPTNWVNVYGEIQLESCQRNMPSSGSSWGGHRNVPTFPFLTPDTLLSSPHASVVIPLWSQDLFPPFLLVSLLLPDETVVVTQPFVLLSFLSCFVANTLKTNQ